MTETHASDDVQCVACGWFDEGATLDMFEVACFFLEKTCEEGLRDSLRFA